jgi:hypothetical protein
MEERPGSAWFGLPAMLVVFAVIAALKAVGGIGGLLLAIVAGVLVLLIVGFAMTVAKRS